MLWRRDEEAADCRPGDGEGCRAGLNADKVGALEHVK